MKTDQVETLIRAHYTRDESRFETTVRQIAAGARSEASRAMLLRLIGSGSKQRAMEMLPMAAQSVLSPVDGCDLDDLVLAADVRAELDAVVVEHTRADALLSHGLFPRSRLLFWGTPGQGKTACAGAIAKALGRQAYVVSIASTLDSFMGNTSKRVRDAMSALAGGLVLIVDEIDAVGAARSAGTEGAAKEWNSCVASLLTELDRRRDGIFVGTTNRADMLDPALRRRFDIELEFRPPSDEAKEELVGRLWESYRLPPLLAPKPNGEESFDAVAKMTMRAARSVILAIGEAAS